MIHTMTVHGVMFEWYSNTKQLETLGELTGLRLLSQPQWQ